MFLSAELTLVGGIADYNQRLFAALQTRGLTMILVERRAGGWLAKVGFSLRTVAAFLIHRPGFIVCTHLHFSPLARILQWLFGTPFAIVVYGTEVYTSRRHLLRHCVRKADLLVYLFEHVLTELETWDPGLKLRTLRLLSAVDEVRFRIQPKSEQLVQQYGLEGRKVLLTLCRMTKEDGDNKGYRRVLATLPKVMRAVGPMVYVLAGGGDDLENVREIVARQGLQEHVVLTGPPRDEEVVDLLNLADLFVLPSKIEGFPAIVLMEALACGVPVVGGAQPGSESARFHGELGWVVPPDDSEQLAAKLIQGLQSPPAAWRDRQALRERALSEYGASRYDKEAEALARRVQQLAS